MPDSLVSHTESILTITLNRPERLNAFSEAMLNGLANALTEARNNRAVRVIVIRGHGRAFSAGGDVKTMGGASAWDVYEHISLLNDVIVAMRTIEKPIIVAVQGFAAGAGFNLALAADLIVASQDAQFVMSFVQVGLISDGGGLSFLPRLVGEHVAKELFFLGEPMAAERAYSLGIVNRLCPADELGKRTDELAERLATGPTQALAQFKHLVNASWHTPLEDMLHHESLTQMVLSQTPNHLEGVQAFLEKRPAQFNTAERED